MTKLTTNVAMCDYVTVTTYDREKWMLFKALRDDLARVLHAPAQESSWYQYVGWGASSDGQGSIFVGSGLQDGTIHFLLTAKGAIADKVYMLLALEGCKCTRLDLQVTIEQPDDYTQRDMQSSSRGVGLDPVYWPSKHGTSLYFGDPKAKDGWFTNLYQKEVDENVYLLRLEVRYRGKRAMAAWGLVRAGKKPGGIIAASMPPVPELIDLYRPYLDEEVIPRVARVKHNTAEWLRSTVLKSFSRYINSHDCDPEIEQLFLDAIERRRRYQ